MKTNVTLVATVLAVISTLHVEAAFNEGDIFKQQVYHQQSGSGSYLDPTAPYSFRASVRNSVSGQTQTLSIPAESTYSPTTFSIFDLVGAHYVFDQRFATFGSMNSAFASGVYSWDWFRPHSTPSIIEQDISLDAPVVFPSISPSIVGGTWSGGILYVDPENFSISSNAWTGAPSEARIEFEMWTSGGAGGSSMGASSTSLTWPFPLAEDRIYDAYLSFRVIDESITIIDTNAPSNQNLTFRSGYANTLYFQISTYAIPEPSSFALLGLGFVAILGGIMKRARKANG